jgi:hypothetical protein
MVDERANYDEFEAAELFCPQCRAARPVRRRLLMVLPEGNRYDYLCTACGSSIGTKTDDDRSAFSILAPK